jgi:hypothetical protein
MYRKEIIIKLMFSNEKKKQFLNFFWSSRKIVEGAKIKWNPRVGYFIVVWSSKIANKYCLFFHKKNWCFDINKSSHEDNFFFIIYFPSNSIKEKSQFLCSKARSIFLSRAGTWRYGGIFLYFMKTNERVNFMRYAKAVNHIIGASNIIGHWFILRAFAFMQWI